MAGYTSRLLHEKYHILLFYHCVVELNHGNFQDFKTYFEIRVWSNNFFPFFSFYLNSIKLMYSVRLASVVQLSDS